MHEVGHTLGLRHNFKGSTWKSVAELSDLDKVRSEGMVGSVMDYAPANIAKTKAEQGLYYTPTIGPYDYWAIEYGYKSISGDEKAELAKIASRSTAETPGPQSSKASRTTPGEGEPTDTAVVPPPYRTALSTTFPIACARRRRSPLTWVGAPSSNVMTAPPAPWRSNTRGSR